MSSTNLINIVDDSLELDDPHPDIHQLYILFDHQFFYGKLNERACTVAWSKRMTSCAGVCQFYRKTGLCCVRLSEPLLKLRRRRDLVETLLHEMIHAYLFVTGGALFMDRDGHGPEFQSHMNRINSLAGTSITIFHSFHAEVIHYKQHWWRCSGPCKERAPYYGWVKRAVNRKPGPYDYWWKQHQVDCGGDYIKVKEPEKSQENTKEDSSGRKRKIGLKVQEANEQNQPRIDRIFSVETSEKASTDLISLPSSSSSNNNNINCFVLDDENDEDICIIGEVVKSPRLKTLKSSKTNDGVKRIFPGKGFMLGSK
uniref:SprT-like domain-containing protein n=1 Tax=Meloidogyne incognita TaxID=6306 RepID=A0A914M5P2_MELIC